ncbi:MAG: serine hydrolase domain-containing protein, partial [Bacteroidota bacterium]
MKSTLIYICSLLLCISGLQLSCTAQTSPRQWNIADEIGDGWSTERPAAVDIREDSIHALLDLINATPPRDFRALVVVRNGQLVVDEYFNSFWRTNIHDIRSAGKSVTSMLAGVAIQRGLFKTSDPVAKFFPEHADKAFAKSTMTVENLLTMSSGLASDDYVDDSPGAEGNMLMADNFLEFCLNLPMDFEPGSRYAYSSVVAFLLGVIIERQSGQKLEDFAKANLFGP